MATVEALSSIVGVTVILLNLYTALFLRIVGSGGGAEWPPRRRKSGFREIVNRLALSISFLILILETSEHSQKTQVTNTLAQLSAWEA